MLSVPPQLRAPELLETSRQWRAQEDQAVQVPTVRLCLRAEGQSQHTHRTVTQ